MRITFQTARMFVQLAMFLSTVCASTYGQELKWIRQFGTNGSVPDWAYGVGVNGEVYVGGPTKGSFPGYLNAGGSDAFLRKYNDQGNEVWTRQFGTSSDEQVTSVCVDSTGIYITGWTLGSLPGHILMGTSDAFVRKYDDQGNVLWTRQFGTSGSDQANGIAVGQSGVYVVGQFHGDAFIRKYDFDGSEEWTRQFGTAYYDLANGVSVDESGVYVTGQTGGTLPGQVSAGTEDAFVRKYDIDGNEIWTRQFGSSDYDRGYSISAGPSGIYVAGSTSGSLPGQIAGGGGDAFVRKYDTDGNEVWTDQLGNSDAQQFRGVATVGTSIFLVGFTNGSLLGNNGAGLADAIVVKYDLDGNVASSFQFGTTAYDYAFGVAARDSAVYVIGTTQGTFAGQISNGSVDGFVAKFDTTTPPNTAPWVVVGGPFAVNEGDSLHLEAMGTDPDNDPLVYEWDLNGDGIFETQGQDVIFSAANLDGPGSQTVSVRATDIGGLTATAQSSVSILNAPPALGTIAAPLDPVQANTSINASAQFTDTGLLDTHTGSWDWGDGNSSAATIDQGTYTMTGSHAYSLPGVYTITATVVDKDGASAQSTYQYVVVYDPSAGYVTGAGWIDSPAGAYAADASLSGRATFGFNSRYQKGASTPDGQTQFHLAAAGFRFQSTGYEWLVIAGAKALYKGSGEINNAGNYGFMLTAVDGAVSGGGGEDKFRIKIWDKDNGDAIVYDNQMGLADDEQPATMLGGGNIVIHSEGGPAAELAPGRLPMLAVPESFALHQNHPNPFNPSTMITYDLPEAGQVNIVVYDMVGKIVGTLVDGHLPAGQHTVQWNAGSLASGMYLCRLQAGTFVETKKLLLVR